MSSSTSPTVSTSGTSPPSPLKSPSDEPFAAHLSSLLPSSLSLSLYHVSTPPRKHAPLFSPPPNQDPQRTTLESHFLTLSHEQVLVFAIEVLIYTVPKQQTRTFFISKADSSGYLPSQHASFVAEDGTRRSTLRTISTAFVRHLFTAAREADPHVTATISLFARSQSQYLFPRSAENAKKHVLTDRGLIAWWGKVLDPILREYAVAAAGEGGDGARGYMLVPGFDARFLIPDGWINGHPFRLDVEGGGVSVREVIPHFPDDPKARYLDELNGGAEGVGGKVKERAVGWRDVKTVEQFWELMSFRQECSLGRCVGFLWVVVEGAKKEKGRKDGIPEDQEILSPTTCSENGQDTSPLPLDSPTMLMPTSTPISIPTPTSPRKRRPSTSTSHSHPTKKKLRTLSFSLPSPSTPASKDALIHSLLILDEKPYTRIIDSLLNHSDFCDEASAKKSSRKWIDSVQPGVAEKEDWGVPVVGKLDLDVCVSAGSESERLAGGGNGHPVNVLSPGLLRRKNGGDAAGVRVLGEGFVRRRNGEGNGVNVLSAGLIRKKPKV